MIRAIDEYRITGVATKLGFCRFVLRHPAFVSGNFDTVFIKAHYSPEMLIEERADEAELAAMLAAAWAGSATQASVSVSASVSGSKWKTSRTRKA